jgi:hypothetical protein
MFRMGRRKSKTGAANENGNPVEESSNKNIVDSSEVMDISPSNGTICESVTPTTSGVVGGDHTSSDYYFDSYGHFGMYLSFLSRS